MYIKKITIDIVTPLIDMISAINLLDNNINAENTRIIKSDIPKIDNEFFSRIRAYTFIIFSFQWRLILFDEVIIRNTLLILLAIELT